MRTAIQARRGKPGSNSLGVIASLLACVVLGGLLAAAPARAIAPEDEDLEPIESADVSDPHMRTHVVDTHDPLRAAHPLRITAYALHPVGVTLDWVLVRPATWVVKREPFRTIFGYED